MSIIHMKSPPNPPLKRLDTRVTKEKSVFKLGRKFLHGCCSSCLRPLLFLLLLLLPLRTMRSKVPQLVTTITYDFTQVPPRTSFLIALCSKSNILISSICLMSTSLRSFPDLLLSEIIPQLAMLNFPLILNLHHQNIFWRLSSNHDS